ncbi:MAG: SMP-30/gluconolactonase/LRE family protein [Proteobacteria bacterium]|nr:SMP-30/gluconolactonase/LRE family protein [Pseudomonadota bacterium]
MNADVQVPWQADALLGKGPVWNIRTSTLYWLDIKGKKLFSLNDATGECRTVELISETGAIAPRTMGGHGLKNRAAGDTFTGPWHGKS